MRSFESWSDAQLLAGTPRDPAAFGAWYLRHGREVLALFRYDARASELAANVTAKTFAAALESIGSYRSELGRGGGVAVRDRPARPGAPPRAWPG